MNQMQTEAIKPDQCLCKLSNDYGDDLWSLNNFVEFVLYKHPNLKTREELVEIINQSKEFPIQDFINCFEAKLTRKQIKEM